MTPERWQKIQDLFHAASEQEPANRSAFLAGACRGDPGLQQEVELLFQSANSLLNAPAWEAAPSLLEDANRPVLAAGDQLGPYRIDSQLGAGGMGEVYKAHDTRLNRTVAIKVLPRSLSDDGGRRNRFLREARAASALNHPNIVTIHDILSENGRDAIVMEYVEGTTLSRIVGPKGLPFREAAAYAIPVAGALAAAHAAGLVHRDLKPGNIMATGTPGRDLKVKVLDFGLAKFAHAPQAASGQSETVTAEYVIVGTPPYMSPEQAQGANVDARSDLFSFGILLYEMLSGRRPFQGDDHSVRTAIVRDDPKPLAAVAASPVPASIEHIVMRCLRKDPDRRFHSAADLKVALEDAVAEAAEITDARAGAAAPSVARWRWLTAAACAAALLAGLAILWLLRSKKAPTSPAPGLKQLTFDGGIDATPAISPDGRLLAFASDRAGAGSIDIWVRQLAGGGLIRLTSQPGAHYNPQFSADGTKIFYLSGDQAIWEVPSLGGPSRQIAAKAGPFTLASTGELVYAPVAVAYSPQPMKIGGPSGDPEPWRPDCRSSPHPAFSPDGSRIFFMGQCGGRGVEGFVAPRRGGTAQRVVPSIGTVSPGFLDPSWFRLADGREGVVYALAHDLSRSDLSAAPRAIFSSADYPRWPAVTGDGQVIFAAAAEQMTVHSIALDGALANVPPADDIATGIGHFAVSRDGSALAYGRLTGGASGELVIRQVASGEEKVFAEHDLLGASFGSLWPQMSPDGKQVVYRVIGNQAGHYLLRVDSGEVRKIAGLQEFQLPSDWSADGKRVLGECPAPRLGICELEIATGNVRKLLVHPTDQLLYPSWSWDGRAIAFMRRGPAGPSGIWIAAVAPSGEVVPESNWVRISTEETDNVRPRFNADGSMVFYELGRNGLVWPVGQRIERSTYRPVGPPVVLSRTPMQNSVLAFNGPYPLITVTSKRLYFSAKTIRGNLYMTPLY